MKLSLLPLRQDKAFMSTLQDSRDGLQTNIGMVLSFSIQANDASSNRSNNSSAFCTNYNFIKITVAIETSSSLGSCTHCMIVLYHHRCGNIDAFFERFQKQSVELCKILRFQVGIIPILIQHNNLVEFVVKLFSVSKRTFIFQLIITLKAFIGILLLSNFP